MNTGTYLLVRFFVHIVIQISVFFIHSPPVTCYINHNICHGASSWRQNWRRIEDIGTSCFCYLFYYVKYIQNKMRNALKVINRHQLILELVLFEVHFKYGPLIAVLVKWRTIIVTNRTRMATSPLKLARSWMDALTVSSVPMRVVIE